RATAARLAADRLGKAGPRREAIEAALGVGIEVDDVGSGDLQITRRVALAPAVEGTAFQGDDRCGDVFTHPTSALRPVLHPAGVGGVARCSSVGGARGSVSSVVQAWQSGCLLA